MRSIMGIAAGLAVAACAPGPVVPSPARAPAPACADATDADFEGEGERRLRGFLAWVAQAHGAAVGIGPDDVSLAIVRGAAKPGPAGVTAAEIGCDAAGYRITLYRNALSGRPLSVTWEVVAHEFHHIVQVRREGLACEAPPGRRAEYEREAAAFAGRVLPECERAGRASAAGP